MSSRSIAVLSVFFAFISLPFLSAQTFRGSIQGTVTDSTGARLARRAGQGLQPRHWA